MSYLRYVSLLGAAVALASCTPQPPSGLTLNPNAIVIPDDQVDSADANGMNVQVENLPTAGQVVISDEGEGLVRRITGVQQTSVGEVAGQIVRKVYLQTASASLEDAISAGEANISMDNLPIGEDNLTQSLEGVSVQNFTGRINLTNVTFAIPGVPNGRITLNGFVEQNLKPTFNLKFSSGSVETFRAGLNGTLKATVRASISASAGYSPFNLSRDLASWNIKRVFTVGAVPVVVVLQPKLVAAVSSGANGQVTVEVGIAPTFTTNMQLDYSRARPANARWQNTFSASFALNPTFTYAAPVQGTGNASTGLVMDVKFYGLLGPSLEAKPFINLNLNGNNGSAGLKSGIQGNSKVEAGFNVLGKGLETSYAGPSVEEARNFTCAASTDSCTAN
ncbi:MAG: hypothetical protein SFU83_06270 [Meiothermus sp.]|nr:hypothetical protein [Meiothermus sp.]